MSNVNNGGRTRRKPNYLNQFKTEFHTHRRSHSTSHQVVPVVPEPIEPPSVDNLPKEPEYHLEIEDEQSGDLSDEFLSEDLCTSGPTPMCHNFFAAIKWLLNFR